MEYKKELDDLFQTVIKEGASDLHIAEDRAPTLRVSGFLIPLVKKEPISRQDVEKILEELLPEEDKVEFYKNKELDFAYTYNKEARFRGNAYFQQGKIGIALRHIPNVIKNLEELNLPSVLEMFVTAQQGFLLVVGPTGNGKSTTLAAIIDSINATRLEHIITIEDPIEYVFTPKKSIIEQREIKVDTRDFHTALKSVFRQDVDVVMVGEMRDPETMSTAVTAAGTGHLVLSTLHTNNAPQTIDRIIDSFPADQQNQIRLQLAECLLGILSQRLVPRVSGGLIPAYELLVANNAVRNLIREKRTHELNMVIETGSDQGMIDLNRCLADLVRRGEITVENALLHSSNQKTLQRLI